MTVKSSKSIQKVPTGYHLAYSDKIMLPQVKNQSKMAQPFDSLSFSVIQADPGCPRQFGSFEPYFWLPLWHPWQNHITTGQKSKQNGPTVWLIECQVDPSTYRMSQGYLILLNLIFGYHFDDIEKTMLPQGINQRKMAQPIDSLTFRLIQAHTGCPR